MNPRGPGMRSFAPAFFVAVAMLAESTLAAAQPDERALPRLRLGLELGAGGDLGEPSGVSVAAFAQLGVQWSEWFALFYQPSVMGHSIGPMDQGNGFFASGHLAMADLTFKRLQLGFGVGASVGEFPECADQRCAERGNVQPAIGGRFAFLLGSPRGRVRVGIPFAVHVHSVIVDGEDHLTSILLTLGVTRY